MPRAFPYSHSENSAEVRRELLDQCHCHPLSFSVVAAVAGAGIELVACFVDSSSFPVLVLGTADASEAAKAAQWDPFVEVSSSLVVSAVAVVVVVVVVVVEIEVSGTVESSLLVEVVLVLLVGTVVEVASSFVASVASDSEVALAEVVDLVAVVVVVDLEAVEVVLLLVLVLLRLLLLLLMLRWSCGCPSVGGVEVLIVDSAGPSFAALVGQPSVDTVAVEEQGQLHQSVDHLRCLADMLHCWERVLCCTAERTTGDKHWAHSKGVVAVVVAGH